MSRIQRLITAASTALLVSALAGPAYAQSDDMRSPDAIDAGTPAVASTAAADVLDARSPDAIDAGTPAVASTAAADVLDARSPDARDASEGATPVVVQVQPETDSGMSWDSAAIGALIAAGLLVSIAGAVALVSRRRAPRRARPAV